MSDKIDTTKFAGHTAGPWRACTLHWGKPSVDSARGSVCSLTTRLGASGTYPRSKEQADVDCRLIAAAPDLLAAYTELSRENAELREEVICARAVMVAVDEERDALRTQVAALQGEVERLKQDLADLSSGKTFAH